MIKNYNFSSLTEDEILKIYELFHGKILMKSEPTEFYLQSLKNYLQKESAVNKVLNHLNILEQDIIKLLSQVSSVPTAYLNEKLSIIFLDHPSHLGKTVQNLISKNYIFQREDKYLFVPDIISSCYKASTVNITKESCKKTTYNCEIFSHVINIIAYFISHEIKFSKTGGLYKKDFELLSRLFCTSSGYLQDEYDIVAYFFSNTFLLEGKLQLDKLRDFFQKTQLERMIILVETVFPYLKPLLDTVYSTKSSYKLKINDLKYLCRVFLISSELLYEPYKADFDNIINFLVEIGLCLVREDDIIFSYYEDSSVLPMELKITNNFTIYANSATTDCDYYICALLSKFNRYDKVTEFEITDKSIYNAIRNDFSFDKFESFILQHNLILGSNVSTTIKDWFSKHNSFFFVKGTVFFAESIEKGKTLTKLIESGAINAFTIKKDSVFLIPEEEQEIFFSFMSRSNFTFFEKKPIKKPLEKKFLPPKDYETFITFNNF